MHIRLYVNVSILNASALCMFLLPKLQKYGIPFTFKIACTRDNYARPDSSVLYAETRHFRLLSKILLDTPGHKIVTRPSTPLFTRRLGPGIALAEDRDPDISFGFDRCSIVAEGLISACESGVADITTKMASIRHAFRQRGLDIEAPYLEVNSADGYRVE